MSYLSRWGIDRSAVQTLGASLVLQLIILVSGVIAARMLGPVDRGNLALFWTITLVISQVAILGLPQAVTYELAKHGWSAMTVMRVLRFRVILLGLLGFAVQSVVLFIVFGTSGRVAQAAALSLTVLPTLVVYLFAVAALQGQERFGRMNFARLLPFAAYSFVLVIGLLIGEESLLFVTSAWAGTYLVASIWAVWMVFAPVKPEAPTLPEPPGAPDAAVMTRFGIAGFLGASPPTETFRPDQLVVGLVLAPISLGLYVAAISLNNLPRFLSLSIGLVAYPRIAALEDRSRLIPEIWKYTGLGALVSALAALPLFFLAEPLLSLFFGSDFTPAAVTVQILLVGAPFLAARRVMGDCLRGANHPEAGTIAELIGWFWLLPALFVGSALAGIEGVAFALSSSFVVSLVATLFLLRRFDLENAVD